MNSGGICFCLIFMLEVTFFSSENNVNNVECSVLLFFVKKWAMVVDDDRLVGRIFEGVYIFHNPCVLAVKAGKSFSFLWHFQPIKTKTILKIYLIFAEDANSASTFGIIYSKGAVSSYEYKNSKSK